MIHKGYEARVTIDEDAGLMHGEVINIRDVVTFQGRSVAELKKALAASVEDYLAFCAARGEDPDKPFSGKFPVRVSPDLHKRTHTVAKRLGVSLNAFVAEALERATVPPGAHASEPRL
jgi:predicted HicB family RNase H-like nuclease